MSKITAKGDLTTKQQIQAALMVLMMASLMDEVLGEKCSAAESVVEEDGVELGEANKASGASEADRMEAL